LASAFAASRTAVLGVSADSPKAQQSFRDKHQLSVPLVSDEQHAMLEAYGVWGEKSMYGRTFQGIVRTTVLIGADGLVAKIWRNVKVDGHADEVLAVVRSL
jgi:peroxiredoxin Q/BCP